MELFVHESVYNKIRQELSGQKSCLDNLFIKLKMEKISILDMTSISRENCYRVDHHCECFVYLYKTNIGTLIFAITNKFNPTFQDSLALNELEKKLFDNS